jgi:hypothetical protein
MALTLHRFREMEDGMRVRLLTVIAAATIVVGCNQTRAETPATALANPVSGAPAPASAPTEGARAASREITIPSGTQLSVALDTPVGSDTSRVEEAVTAHLTRPVRVEGQTVLPAGTRLSGVVTDATRSARVKGLAHVAMQFKSITPDGGDERYAIRTASLGRTAAATKRKDALEIGAPAAGGAIIGALVGGKKGALVGTAIGGGAGTAAVLSTRGREVHLAKGAALTVRLTAPVTVVVKG